MLCEYRRHNVVEEGKASCLPVLPNKDARRFEERPEQKAPTQAGFWRRRPPVPIRSLVIFMSGNLKYTLFVVVFLMLLSRLTIAPHEV